MLSKKELRTKISEMRNRLTSEEIAARSKQICKLVTEHKYYRKTADICLYMPVRNEVDTSYIMTRAAADGKTVWLPKVNAGRMQFLIHDDSVPFAKGPYGILEPQTQKELVPDSDTLVIMPGAVFSREGNRIGYGGGYYDRFLAEFPMCMTIAVCYDFQIVDEVPAEVHDIRPQVVISA